MTEYLFESRLLVAILQASVKAATERGAIECCLGMENVLKYCPAYEGGISCQRILKFGTTATAIHLDDCKFGAFINRAILHVSLIKSGRQ